MNTTTNISGNNRKYVEIALHIFVWFILFSFPLLFSTNEMPKSSSLFFRAWMPIFFSAIIFYINYFCFIEKLLFKNNIIWFIIINIVLVAVSIYSIDIIREYLSPPREDGRSFRDSRFYYYVTLRQVFSFALTIGIAFAVKSISRWQQSEMARKNLENENLRAELKNLKYQIQPHFFLNTLNNIYALTDISTERAKEAIHGLGKLMRYLLYDTNTDLVSLQKEIDFMEKYIQLMKMRLHNQVDVHYVFPLEFEDRQVPPLLMIPLIENAFKHGVSANQQSFIKIELKLENNMLEFSVKNSNYPKGEQDQGGSGIGLENLERRLRLISDNQFSLDKQIHDNVFNITLKIKTNG